MKPAILLPVSATIAILGIFGVAVSMVWADPTDVPPAVWPRTDFVSVSSQTSPSDESPSDENLPAPGIYESVPYACIIKVPESTGDNCVIGQSAPSMMPVKHPDLKLVPISLAEK